MKSTSNIAARLTASERGLTLIEIIVVLIILGILITVLGGKIFSSAERAKADLTRIRLKQIQSTIEEFRLRYSSLPAGIDDLVKCSERTGSGCIPVAKEEDLKDGWGNPVTYALDSGGRAYRIKSLGADGRDGGTEADSDIVVTGP